jgi:hypothetical protein
MDAVTGLVAGGLGTLFARAATGENQFEVHDQLLSQLLTHEPGIPYSEFSTTSLGNRIHDGERDIPQSIPPRQAKSANG